MAGTTSFLKDTFGRVFGPCDGLRMFRGPGRVNLIGEHTDYNLGFVMPAALDMACFIATTPADDGRLTFYSENLKESRDWAVADTGSLKPAKDWSDYVAGVALELVRLGYQLEPKKLLIWSTVPVGSGLSSSAALEVSTALALLGGQQIDKLELVKLCRRAENNFVGMPCGIMDQYISVFGRENSAIKIDCRSLENEAAPIPASVEIIAVNTMVKHELGASAYRNRVRECGEAVEAIRKTFPAVSSLRDVSVADFAGVEAQIPEVPRKRARHVVTEDQRVTDFVAASRAGDLKRMGELFVASHRSLQHDYEVSCEELDFLVDTAIGLPGVYGARMTGGGFGGCTVNLLDRSAASEFEEAVRGAYKEHFGIEPQIYRCHPSAGASELV